MSIIEKDTDLMEDRSDMLEHQINEKNKLISELKQTIRSINTEYLVLKNIIDRSFALKLFSPALLFYLRSPKLKNALSRLIKFFLKIETKSFSQIEDILGRNFLVSNQVVPRLFTQESERINLLIDALTETSLYGGLATAVIFGIKLANKLQCPLRLITFNKNSDIAFVYAITKKHQIEPPLNCELVNFSYDKEVNKEKHLTVSSKDIFISTIWWTTVLAKDITAKQKHIWLVQEYEKIFYPNSDQQVIIDQLLSDSNVVPVVNTKILYDFFLGNAYSNIKEQGVYFEPAFPQVTTSKVSVVAEDKKYKLFFYSRPNTPRNLFLTGINLLNEAIKRRMIDKDEWNIYFAGDNVGEISFDEYLYPKFLGKLNWDEYVNFVQEVDLGICLMYAPCPSYPPLDVAVAGGVVLTNQYKNKISLDHYSKNIICSELDIETLLSNLEIAIDLAKNKPQRQANVLQNKINKNWHDSFDPILNKVVEQVSG